MSVESTDVLLKLSTVLGSSGNSEPGFTGESLGKYISSTQVASATLHNLFPEVTGAENEASNVDYQCVFVHNSNASDTFLNVRIYILDEVAGGADAAVGTDPTGASAISSSAAQAVEIANKDTAPAGVSFSTPLTLNSGIQLGDLGPGQCRAFWVRRSAGNTDPASNDGVTLRVQGETL